MAKKKKLAQDQNDDIGKIYIARWFILSGRTVNLAGSKDFAVLIDSPESNEFTGTLL